MSPLDLPSIDLLGIYPNGQGIAVQVAMVAAAAAMLWLNRRRALGGGAAA